MAVIPGDFGWDDVGTWASLKRARDLDDDGNGAAGGVRTVDASASVVHAEGASVVLYGVEGLLVVTLPGITFVTTLERRPGCVRCSTGSPKSYTPPGPRA